MKFTIKQLRQVVINIIFNLITYHSLYSLLLFLCLECHDLKYFISVVLCCFCCCFMVLICKVSNVIIVMHLMSLLNGTFETEHWTFSASQSQLASIASPNHSGDANESGSPVRKNFLTPSPPQHNQNLTTINQHLNNLGSINHQLNTLSQQLCGLNQQSQQLNNFQNVNNNNLSSNNNFGNQMQQQQLLQSTPPAYQQQHPMHQDQQQHMQKQDLFQSNQELLNRLQNLSLGYSNTNSINSYSPQNAFVFANPNQLSLNNNNHSSNSNINMNLLSSPSSTGNLTPSPIMNRSIYSVSPSLFDENLGASMERNLDRTGGHQQNYQHQQDNHFIRPIPQVGAMTTIDSDGKVKVVVPVSQSDYRGSPDGPSGTQRRSEKKVTLSELVTLKVTDERGNSRKLSSATPSYITRSTSEKAPNRSQIMSEVQRTTWARHTTK